MNFLQDDNVEPNDEDDDVGDNFNGDVVGNDAQDIRDDVADGVIGHNTNAEMGVSEERRELS